MHYNLNALQEKAAYFSPLFLIIYLFVYSGAISMCAQVLAYCEKMSEAALMLNRVSSSQLQDSHISGQS